MEGKRGITGPDRTTLSWNKVLVSALLFFTMVGFGWWTHESLPDEFPVQLEELDRKAWTVGVQTFFEERYAKFHREVRALRNQFRQERNRWWPSLNVEEFNRAYQKLVDEGTLLIQGTKQKRLVIRQEIEDRIMRERAQVLRLRAASKVFDLQRDLRALSQAEALLEEADRRLHANQLKQTKRAVQSAAAYLQQVEIHTLAQMVRYTEAWDLSRWRNWYFRTVKWSETTGDLALVIVKASREARIYKGGKVTGRYPIDLGFNGFEDKRYEGDGATPEGQFKVVRKKEHAETKFYKALLLNYPTEGQKRRFLNGRRQGLIADSRSIGGLIEIHGTTEGGGEFTNGCVSLPNEAMDYLFELVRVGTPVTIVGAIDRNNPVMTETLDIENHRRNRPEWVIVTKHT